MERRQLEYFVAVADAGSLAAAATELHVTQPALSQAIRQLEASVGCELFHRVPRGMRLTSAGRALLEPAQLTLHGFTAAQAAVDEVVGLSRGTLDLATLPGLVIEPLADSLRAFRAGAPAVLVRLRQFETPQDVIESVRSGEAELGFAFGVPEHVAGIVRTLLGAQELVAVLPPGARVGESVTFAELEDYGLVSGHSGSSVIEPSGDPTETADPVRLAVRVDRRETALSLILRGVGAGILPRAFGDLAALQQAVVRPLRPPVRRPIYLVRRDAPLTPACRRFIALTMASLVPE